MAGPRKSLDADELFLGGDRFSADNAEFDPVVMRVAEIITRERGTLTGVFDLAFLRATPVSNGFPSTPRQVQVLLLVVMVWIWVRCSRRMQTELHDRDSRRRAPPGIRRLRWLPV